MVRVVKTMDGVAVDARQRMPGRGAYVHADAKCVQAAVRPGGLARALKCAVPASLEGDLMEGRRGSARDDGKSQGIE